MNCPKCGKTVINEYALECDFCHAELYSDEKQISKIKRKKRAKKVGSFFAVAISTVILWAVVICVVKFSLNEPFPSLQTTNDGTVFDVTYNETVTQAVVTEPETTIVNYNSQDVWNYTIAYVPEMNSPGYNVSPGGTPDYAPEKSNDTTSATKSSSTTKAPKPVKPSKDNTQAYKTEIENENKKHQDEIARINAEYDWDIEYCQEDINFCREICGYMPSSSYPSQIASLEEKIRKNEQKLAFMQSDTSNQHASQISALQRELEQDYARLSDLQVAYDFAVKAEQSEKELSSLQSQKTAEINKETERHNRAIEEINSKYGK